AVVTTRAPRAAPWQCDGAIPRRGAMGTNRRGRGLVEVCLGLAIAIANGGCDTNAASGADASSDASAGDDGSAMFGVGDDDAAIQLTCDSPGVQCSWHCDAGATTSLTGHVFDPAGKHPLPNALVYIPNAVPPPITPGTSLCTPCSIALPDYVAATVTDASG